MTSTISLALLALALVSTGLVAEQISAEDIGYERGSLAFPFGDPETGEYLFTHFRCNSCHRVSGSGAADRAPISANPGPDLSGVQSPRNACGLASSIISPSHSIPADVQRQSEGQLSPMGDYSQIMTVRQLIDLVTYLKSVDER